MGDSNFSVLVKALQYVFTLRPGCNPYFFCFFSFFRGLNRQIILKISEAVQQRCSVKKVFLGFCKASGLQLY